MCIPTETWVLKTHTPHTSDFWRFCNDLYNFFRVIPNFKSKYYLAFVVGVQWSNKLNVCFSSALLWESNVGRVQRELQAQPQYKVYRQRNCRYHRSGWMRTPFTPCKIPPSTITILNEYYLLVVIIISIHQQSL